MAAAIDARLALINGTFPLPAETTQVMGEIRAAISDAAASIDVSIRGKKRSADEPIESTARIVKYDVGRLIAALDLLQQAKDVACAAVILPHHQ